MLMPTFPRLLDEKAAAALLGLKPQTLSEWRCMKRYNLPFIKVGRKVRYRESDLLKWLESNTVTAKEK